MKLTINLASRPYINRRALMAVYAALAAALVLLLALNIGFLLHSRSHSRELREQLAEIERQLAADEMAVVADFTPKAYEDLLQRITFANEILEQDNFRWTALLGRLEEVVPDNVGITSLEPNFKERKLALKGVARRVEDLRRLLDNLIAAPDLHDVYLLQQSQLTGRGAEGEGISFTIDVQGAF